MKIEQKKAEFQPITITLETEQEARLLKTLLGKTNTTHDDHNVNDFYYETYKQLDVETLYKNYFWYFFKRNFDIDKLYQFRW